MYGPKNAWEDLANAIILTAVQDFKQDYIHLIRNPKSKAAKKSIEQSERFFLSAWFDTLSLLDGPTLLRQIKEKIDEEYGK